MTTRRDDDPAREPAWRGPGREADRMPGAEEGTRDDDPLLVVLRPGPDHLGPPPGRYEAIRRTAARRRARRAAAGIAAACAAAAVIALPLRWAGTGEPARPVVPLAPVDPAPAPTPPPAPPPASSSAPPVTPSPELTVPGAGTAGPTDDAGTPDAPGPTGGPRAGGDAQDGGAQGGGAQAARTPGAGTPSATGGAVTFSPAVPSTAPEGRPVPSATLSPSPRATGTTGG
ncbi:hypothetical protein [Streptomyces sp. SID8352]|uniref:hypothetical protein n=1 Tax=Streptomyces sp. SID8352 TaxID=2690338 RepID=UPI0031F60DFC